MPSQANSKVTPARLLDFNLAYCSEYLASGGATSRVEEQIVQLGKLLGRPTEVFATPTGVFLSVRTHGESPITGLSRIKEIGFHLGRVCALEGLLQKVLEEKISIEEAHHALSEVVIRSHPYRKTALAAAAFIAGTTISYSSFQNGIAAIACGALSALVWWITGPALADRLQSTIFKDFIGSVVAALFALSMQVIYPVNFEAYSIGAIVLLVPGLSLTTSISELADQNLVSGTAKLMRSLITLLAMGLAFLLVQELTTVLNLKVSLMAMKKNPVGPLLGFIGIVITTSCFGMIFKIPLRTLPGATLSGILGWTLLHFMSKTELTVGASFLTSLMVAFTSLALGRLTRLPSQVFLIPGIMAMLPGMLALSSIRTLATGDSEDAINLAFKVAITIASIVFGLFTARIPFAILKTPRKPTDSN